MPVTGSGSPAKKKKIGHKIKTYFYELVLKKNWGCLTAWGKKLLCSLVLQQRILLCVQRAAEQLAYNITCYVELHIAVGLLSWAHNITSKLQLNEIPTAEQQICQL